MTLSLGQMEYGGQVIGPGGIAQLVSVDGLTGLSTSRNQDIGRPNWPGMLAGYDFPGDRQVTINVQVTGSGSTTMQQNLAALRTAFLMSTTCGGGPLGYAGTVQTQQLTYNLGEALSSGAGTNRLITARCRKFDVTADISFAGGGWEHGLASGQILLDAVDPNIYDASTQSGTVGLTVATGGLTFPATVPFLFGSQSGGLIYAANLGNTPCPPLLTITGPCQYPRVEQQTLGVTIQFDTDLDAGDSLVVDCYQGTATLNGTVSRINALAPGSFITTFLLPTGTSEIGFYSNDASATGATLTVQWANTWG